MGLNPGTIYWMDIFSYIFVVKICNVCLKRPKINKKEAGLAHFLSSMIVFFGALPNASKSRLSVIPARPISA